VVGGGQEMEAAGELIIERRMNLDTYVDYLVIFPCKCSSLDFLFILATDIFFGFYAFGSFNKILLSMLHGPIPSGSNCCAVVPKYFSATRTGLARRSKASLSIGGCLSTPGAVTLLLTPILREAMVAR
jgi:hypothetical protein